jgi:hypothetical protein
MAALVPAAGEHPEGQSDTWSAFNPYPCEHARAVLRMGRNIMNRRTTLVLAAALLVVPAFAADPSGFALWKSAELKQRDEALSKKVGPDHSKRGKTGGGMNIRFPGRHESDSLRECRRLQTLTSFHLPI